MLAGKGWEWGLTTKDLEGSLWIETFILDFDGHLGFVLFVKTH